MVGYHRMRIQAARKVRSSMHCVSLETTILTRRGWLAHDRVKTGDETIGYNPATRRSEWTPIIKVDHSDDVPVWRIGHAGWHANVTPNHRWFSDTEHTVVDGHTSCPECGWVPRGVKMPQRGVQVHRKKIHGLDGGLDRTEYREEFIRTEDMGSHHRLRLAAPADTDGIPSLSVNDVAIIAWLQGDGHIRAVFGKPTICPECGYLPGDGRKPHRGPVSQPANSVAVHRARIHHVSRDEADQILTGEFDGTIYQSKPPMVTKIRTLLAQVEHNESVRKRGGNSLPAHAFRLRRAYVTDLMKRSSVIEKGPEAFVLALSPDQRAAWLSAMIDAEGYRQPGKQTGWSEFVRIAQVDGPSQDAIRLAVFLEGWRPTYSANSAGRNGFQPAGTVGMARAHVAPSTFHEPEVLGNQTVWCVTTDLGTWSAKNDGHVFLTGDGECNTLERVQQARPPGTDASSS